MTNTNEINKRIFEAVGRKERIAAELGISLSSLNNKIANRTEFKASEISILKKTLKLTDDDVFRIFFKPKVSKSDTLEVANA